MGTADLNQIQEKFDLDGYYFPMDAFSEIQAQNYRTQIEEIEKQYSAESDDPLWKTNANQVLPFVDEITRLPSILEPVSVVLGPDILVWSASFFIKEANTTEFVSWHQDLKYWGLNHTEEITAWVALSPATRNSGCMGFIPGSHKQGLLGHKDTFAVNNLLSRGQVLEVEVDEGQAVDVVLKPGQFSLHHGHMFHASQPNQSNDRRIGLAIRYITPRMGFRDGSKSYATLVSGNDRIGNFYHLESPQIVMNPSDMELAVCKNQLGEKYFYANADR